MTTPTPPLPPPSGLPRLRLVLAVSLDGRLAPPQGGAAQIGGRGDRRVLEEALAWADGALLGAETLRRHGSTCLIHADDLLACRRQQGRPEQPVALVASRSGAIPASLPFFDQPLERWLLLAQTSQQAAASGSAASEFPDGSPSVFQASDAGLPLVRDVAVHAVEAAQPFSPPADSASAGLLPAGFARSLLITGWEAALRQLAAEGLERLVVLGGAALAASLLAENRLDELQLTLCPRLLGGEHSWLPPAAPVPLAASSGWRLLEQRCLEGEELLLRYGREAPQI